MSDSIELFKPEGFTPSDLRPPNVTFKLRNTRGINKEAAEIYRNAHKRTAAGSVQNVVTNKSMRLSNDFNHSHRLSMRLDDGQGPSPVSSQSNDGLPTDKHSFPDLKERLEIQKARELNVDTDNPQFIKFLKYGIRKDKNEWSLPRSLGDIKILKKTELLSQDSRKS